MTKNQLHYRCRMCGKVERVDHPDAASAFLRASSGRDIPSGTVGAPRYIAKLTEVHYCGEGQYGLADLIGAVGP